MQWKWIWNFHVILLEVVAMFRLEMDSFLNVYFPKCPVFLHSVSLCLSSQDSLLLLMYTSRGWVTDIGHQWAILTTLDVVVWVFFEELQYQIKVFHNIGLAGLPSNTEIKDIIIIVWGRKNGGCDLNVVKCSSHSLMKTSVYPPVSISALVSWDVGGHDTNTEDGNW